MTQREGETSKQMLAAPQGAVFVWCNLSLDYPRRLARHLGRGDLRIETPRFFENGAYHGIRVTVVVDHAAHHLLTRPQWEGWRDCMRILLAMGIKSEAPA